MEDKVTRRSFFKLSLAAVTVIPFIANMAKSYAADACGTPPAGKKVGNPNEGMGKSLDYVADAKTSKNALYKAGASCANCKFYKAAQAENGYAPCTMMGMAYVSNCGWCKSYSK